MKEGQFFCKFRHIHAPFGDVDILVKPYCTIAFNIGCSSDARKPLNKTIVLFFAEAAMPGRFARITLRLILARMISLQIFQALQLRQKKAQ